MKQNLANNEIQLLIFEPSVFFLLRGKRVLIYDADNGLKLTYESPIIVSFLSESRHEYYHYFFLPSKNNINEEIKAFIDDITKNKFGFLILKKDDTHEPVQFVPQIIHKQISSLHSNSKGYETNVDIRNLNEITVFLNNKSIFSDMSVEKKESVEYKSSSLDNLDNQLNLEEFCKFVQPALVLNTLFRINIKGKIFVYSQLSELVSFIRKHDKKLHINYFVDFESLNSNIDLVKEILVLNSTITLIIKSSLYQTDITNLIYTLGDKWEYIKLQCIVENKKDFYNFQEMLDKIVLSQVIYKPYFNGNNYSFFEENIFLNIDDINSLKPSKVDVLKRQHLNPLDFGKIIILSNGNVHANCNNPIIGNISNDNIYNIIGKELTNGKSWLKTRKMVNPCKSCIYEIICPPISNYEYIFKRFNLCHIII